MGIEFVHTAALSLSSALMCVGVGIPYWMAFTHIFDSCYNKGYSGLWLSCSTHCTVHESAWKKYLNKVDNTAQVPDPFNSEMANCDAESNLEMCYDAKKNKLVYPGPLMATQVLAMIAFVLSSIGLGFAIVRWKKWAQISSPKFTLIMALLSVFSGVCGIITVVLLPTVVVNLDDDQISPRKAQFLQPGLLLFSVGSALNLVDGVMVIVVGSRVEKQVGGPPPPKEETKTEGAAAVEEETEKEATPGGTEGATPSTS